MNSIVDRLGEASTAAELSKLLASLLACDRDLQAVQARTDDWAATQAAADPIERRITRLENQIRDVVTRPDNPVTDDVLLEMMPEAWAKGLCLCSLSELRQGEDTWPVVLRRLAEVGLVAHVSVHGRVEGVTPATLTTRAGMEAHFRCDCGACDVSWFETTDENGEVRWMCMNCGRRQEPMW